MVRERKNGRGYAARFTRKLEDISLVNVLIGHEKWDWIHFPVWKLCCGNWSSLSRASAFVAVHWFPVTYVTIYQQFYTGRKTSGDDYSVKNVRVELRCGYVSVRLT